MSFGKGDAGQITDARTPIILFHTYLGSQPPPETGEGQSLPAHSEAVPEATTGGDQSTRSRSVLWQEAARDWRTLDDLGLPILIVLMVILALAMLVGIGRGLIAWLEHRQRVYLSRGPMPIVRSGLKRPRKS